MTIIFILVLGCFAGAMLWYSGAFSFVRKPAAPNPLAQMRALLLARAEGKIGQEEFERAQAALHLVILDQPATGNFAVRVIVPALVVIVAVLVFYVWNGKAKESPANSPTSSRVVVNSATVPSAAMPSAAAPSAANAGGDLSTAVKHLEAKLEKNPNNRDGWLLLAKTYKELGRLKEADDANAKAAALPDPGK